MTQNNGKGSAPRPIPNYDQYRKNWDSIFKPKVRVSGVPYEVELEDALLAHEPGTNQGQMSMDDMIATLEQENKYLRARIERLEGELRNASRND
jgi:hypothetical protein